MRMLPRSWMRRMFPVLVAVVALEASVADATSVTKMTFSEVVASAEVIAVGVVSAIRDTWDADLQLPFTEVTFSELEVLKGGVGGAELALRFLGGLSPGGEYFHVSGMPRFGLGDRVVVFSSDNGVTACPLVGWWQGYYRLLFDPAQETFTVADHVGRPVVAISGSPGRLETSLSTDSGAQTTADALTLEEFRNAVRTAAR